jgi:hypothetical protein
VGGELDLLVPPLRCPVLTGDQAGPMDATEIPIDESVPSLRVVISTVGEPEVPLRVLVPRVRLEEGVLVVGARLSVAPIALQHVLVSVDELSRVCHGELIDRVRSHTPIMAASVYVVRMGEPESTICPICGKGTLITIDFGEQQPESRQVQTFTCGHEVEGARLQTADAEKLDVERRTSEETAQPTDPEE